VARKGDLVASRWVLYRQMKFQTWDNDNSWSRLAFQAQATNLVYGWANRNLKSSRKATLQIATVPNLECRINRGSQYYKVYLTVPFPFSRPRPLPVMEPSTHAPTTLIDFYSSHETLSQTDEMQEEHYISKSGPSTLYLPTYSNIPTHIACHEFPFDPPLPLGLDTADDFGGPWEDGFSHSSKIMDLGADEGGNTEFVLTQSKSGVAQMQTTFALSINGYR
jgi:hypothetical protein